MSMIMSKLKNLVEVCFEGEMTVSKRVLWLAGTVCLLSGIVYGLRVAPLTHGICIGCNNTSQNDCTYNGTDDSGKEGKGDRK